MGDPNRDPGAAVWAGDDLVVSEVWELADDPADPVPLSAPQLLDLMRSRLKYLGAPLPEGYVPPPGIDLDALLKEVPWPPPANG
jgi:hypothetical protein